MNISIQGNLFGFSGRGMLKSRQEQVKRQQETAKQVDFYEAQKDHLKDMECNSPEETKRKLEMLHSYDAQIAAVKAAYNHEQMSHLMDEAREIGEKIGEMAEKYKPKTLEERKEELVKEAMGTEEQDGLLTEVLENTEVVRETMEEKSTEETMAEEAMEEEKIKKEMLEKEIIEKKFV